MKKLNCAICDKYKKFKNRKISYIFLKALVLSIDCSKCNNEDEKYLKKKNQLRYWRFLIKFKMYNYFKNMIWEIRLKRIDETKNYFLRNTEKLIDE